MRTILSTITLFFALSLTAIANCDATFTYVVQNHQVHFYATSSVQGVTYSWHFGDGNTGTGDDPWHTYTVYPEHYTVCMIAYQQSTGCADTVCQTVFIQSGPTQSCEASLDYIVVGNQVHLLGGSNVPGVDYLWDFGDGQIETGSNNDPWHTYTVYPEHYNVCLIITNGSGCADTICENIYVQSGPVCDADFNYSIAGNPYTVEFDAVPSHTGTIHWWDFGNGASATIANPSHTYTAPGVYDVCHYIYNQSTGCSDTICQPILISGCDASYTYNSTNSTFSFQATYPADAYWWDFGDGHTGSGQYATHTYAVYPEHYTVCLYTVQQVTNCWDTVCQVVYAPNCGSANFTYTNTGSHFEFDSETLPPSADHVWDFGDGIVSYQEDPDHNFSNPGTYTVCHYYWDNVIGCSDTVCEVITVPHPPCEAAITYNIIDNQVHFFGTSNVPGVDYVWDFGDGHITTGDSDPWHTYTVYPEHYDVCLIITNSSGCADTVCENIYIQNGPATCEGTFTYTITGNQIYLNGASNISSPVTYSWYFGDGTSGVGQNISHTYNVYPEHYDICMVITNTATGCSDTTCQNVYIQSGPQACEGAFTYTINNNQVSFHGTANVNNVTYYWSFGDASGGTGQNITHSYNQYPEHYQVCMYLHNNVTNCSDTVCETIYIQNGPNQNCQAAMSYNIVDNTVTFVGTSNIPNANYHWTFGDGHVATTPTAVHTYSQYPEHYQVCLYVYDSNSNCADTICETIYIQNGPPQSCEGAFTYVIQGNNVHFYGTSNVPGVNYTWIFGDGHVDSGNNNDPWHTYSQYPEHYNVCMIITNSGGCADTVCQTIYIQNNGGGNNCQAAFTYQIDQNEVHFYGTSTEPNVDYHWMFGDGTYANGQNPSHTYSQYPEHYTVCLVIHNNNTGCLDTVCQTIFIQGGGTGSNCQATFTYSITNNVVSFQGASTDPNVDYHWIFGDGHDANGQNVTHSYSQFPEHYNVCLIIHNSSIGCWDTICQTIYVQQGVACSSEFTYTITGNEVHFHGPSNSSGANYHWDFGDGSDGNGQNPNHHYTQFPEHYDVCLTVTNSGGCNSTTCHNIYIQSGNTSQYDLSGTVYAGNNFGDEGTVYLIKYNPSVGSLQAVATTPIGANGFFTFNVPAGNYFLKAALSSNSVYYHHWLPTYYDHELWWNQAHVISLNANMSRSVHLVEGINPGGPGFVAGLVTQGANKTNGPGDPVEGVMVMLLNMQDEPVQYTYSNSVGEFSFNNLAYGTYKVWGEVLNLTTTPAIVTINSNNQEVVDLNLLVTSKEVTTGVFEQAVLNNASVGELFPNPTTGDAAFYMNLTENAEITLRVFDITGRQVYSDILNLSSGDQKVELPTANLLPGVYSMVLVEEKANSTVNRKLIKLK